MGDGLHIQPSDDNGRLPPPRTGKQEIAMKGRIPPEEPPDDGDEIRRVLRKDYGFRRLSDEEVDQLSEEEIERLEDAYDAACAREVVKAVEEGRMKVVSGQELKEELDRICGLERRRNTRQGG